MKIYTRVVMSMETGETLEEESFEYSGEISECKGGDTYDEDYNSRLAAIQEQYANMAEGAYNSWNTGGARALEEATSKAGLSLLPAQTELASAQIGSSMSLLPGQTALSAAQTSLGLQKTANQSSIMDKFYSSLGKHDESTAMNEAGSTMASAYANQEKAATLDASRRGVAYKPSAGLTSDKAKAIGLAQNTALQNTRTQNIDELAKGLAI